MHNPKDILQDRYTVGRELGKGAFATTYLCEDMQTQQQVAIKAMNLLQLDAWKSFELFEREARVLKSLDHPGIPDFYDTFRIEQENGPNIFYLVQEYIEGQSLQDMLDEGKRLVPEKVMQLARGILDILDHLHSQSPPLVHRDIKPSNILLKSDGSPVLIDFGSVCDGWRAKDGAGSTVAGTHGYMPPEQYMGHVSPQSDLYGFGATILHVITGKAPYEFSFDTGRIEIPDNMPSKHIHMLLNDCLNTAPKARPISAQHALKLLDNAQEQPKNSIIKRANHLVSLGPPPRKPDGPDRAVFLALHPQVFSTIMGASVTGVGDPAAENSFGGLLLYLLFTLCLAGIWIPLYYFVRLGHLNKVEALFKHGIYTEGYVLGLNGGGQNNMEKLSFSFTVDGTDYRSSCTVKLAGLILAPTDPIGILYDPNNPAKAVPIYKYQKPRA